MTKKHFLLGLSMISSTQLTKAAENDQRTSIESNRALIIEYSQKQWNQNPKSIESAFIILKDSTTQKMLTVQLSETAPDSGVFKGQFTVSLSQGKPLLPEVFVPPMAVLKSPKATEESSKLIAAGKLKRAAHVLFRSLIRPEQQIMSVHDSKESALEAYNKYITERDAFEAKQAAKKSEVTSSPTSQLNSRLDSDAQQKMIDAQKLSALEAEKIRLAALAQDQELKRKREIEAEEEKSRLLKEQQAAMSAAKQQQQKDLAKKVAERALQLYLKDDFAKAEPLFKKSLELDPNNNLYYYQYAITLFRLEKFESSLVMLEMSNHPDVNKFERDYFKALCHVRLNNKKSAIENFDKVIVGNDPVLAPASEFYKGVLFFNYEEYVPARKSFERVLDTSKDPALDNQSEEYIEKIANIQQFNAQKKKKVFINFLMGGNYDSNVLQTDPTGVFGGNPLGYAAVRSLVSLGADVRALYTPKHEVTIKASVLDMRSDNASVQSADPTIVSAAIPYKYRGELFGKGFQLATTASYDSISLNSVAAIQTTSLKFETTHIMSESYLQGFLLQFQSDASTIEGATGDGDPTSSRIQFNYTSSHFLNKAKNKAWIYDAGLISNNALGKNLRNQRLSLGATHLRPWYLQTNLSLRGALFGLQFADRDDKRLDINAGITATLTRPINSWMSGLFTTTVMLNDSNVDINSFQKYSMILGLTMTPSF